MAACAARAAAWRVAPPRWRMLESGFVLSRRHRAVRVRCEIIITVGARSSAGRALRSQCRGREFDPPRVHHHFTSTRTQAPGPQTPLHADHADPLGVDFAACEWNRIAHDLALRLLLRLLHSPAVLLSLALVHVADLEDNGIRADGILPGQLRLLIATGTRADSPP